jgi:hypothetical protein
MVDWEKSFRAYLIKKMSIVLGIEIADDSVEIIDVSDYVDFEVTTLALEELPMIYAFALMRENFESAKEISDEIESRNARITFDIDEKTNTGQINLYVEPETDVAYANIKMVITPDGVMVDWDKQNF